MAEGRECASPIMGGAAGDTPDDQDNPHLRTDFEPVNDDWDPISEQPSRPCGCDRPRAQGRTDDTTTKCRNVEKIHVGGVIHRCTGVQKFLMAFYVVFGVALGWSLVAFDWPGMVAEWTLSGLGSSPTPELKLGLDRLVLVRPRDKIGCSLPT